MSCGSPPELTHRCSCLSPGGEPQLATFDRKPSAILFTPVQSIDILPHLAAFAQARVVVLSGVNAP